MRWVFLLLIMLNAFYYVWHQQEAPLRPKEVTPLSLNSGGKQPIQLLSESAAMQSGAGRCLFIGGGISQAEAEKIEQRLMSLDIQAQVAKRLDSYGPMYWVKIGNESRRLVDESLVGGLRQDFPQLKNKIMSCEGIATFD